MVLTAIGRNGFWLIRSRILSAVILTRKGWYSLLPSQCKRIANTPAAQNSTVKNECLHLNVGMRCDPQMASMLEESVQKFRTPKRTFTRDLGEALRLQDK